MNNAINTTMKTGDLYSSVTDGKIISDIELQRDIVYDGDKQALVIDSILNDIPLPAFYMWKNENEILEVLDGKQRIEAIRKFRQNELQYRGKIWKEIGPEMQSKFNNTELSVIISSGSEQLKHEIFRRINTLGVPLSAYEVLNGLYHGEYLEELTSFCNMPTMIRIFGNNSRGKNQMHFLKWLMILDKKKGSNDDITNYVKEKKDTTFEFDKNRMNPYLKFVRDVFTDTSLVDMYFDLALKYQKDFSIWKMHRDEINKMIKMFKKSNDWKLITDKKGELEDRIRAIVGEISVDAKRLFTTDDKITLLEAQIAENGKYRCKNCNQLFYPNELTVDHITPWSKGGRTVLSNAQLLCAACNSSKGNRL